MTSPFSSDPAGTPNAPTVNWSGFESITASTFVPYPNLGQPGYDEVGYGEGGYGEGGYDTPSIPATLAPTTLWTLVATK